VKSLASVIFFSRSSISACLASSKAYFTSDSDFTSSSSKAEGSSKFSTGGLYCSNITESCFDSVYSSISTFYVSSSLVSTTISYCGVSVFSASSGFSLDFCLYSLYSRSSKCTSRTYSSRNFLERSSISLL